jgi:alcohol dehydrogenase (cytochrome c)
MTTRRRVLAIGLVLASLAFVGLVLSWSSLQWRAQLVAWKLRGSMPDMTWGELYRAVTPGNRYLDHRMLFSTRNVFGAIRNPYSSEADVEAGRELFDARCLACHDQSQSGGHGAGPDLSKGDFKHGSSDWALFRIVAHGIPGTAMIPIDMEDNEIWQVIAFVKSVLGKRSIDSASAVTVPAPQVSYERLVESDREPNNWLTYSGSFSGQRYSRLSQIDASNVDRLDLKWVYQTSSPGIRFETTPLVVDGVMYLTEPPNDVVALATDTGRVLWTYRRKPPPAVPVCCGQVNRGLAILGDTLFLGTIDAHLVALDARTGAVTWETEVADHNEAYSITGAPLALKGMVITGVGGGDYATRCFVAAYDARTGKEVWRFHTIPEPGARITTEIFARETISIPPP